MTYQFTPRPGTLLAKMQAARESLEKQFADNPELAAEYEGAMLADAAKYDTHDHDGGAA